jgi:purine-binding chemotaxis protein CheW
MIAEPQPERTGIDWEDIRRRLAAAQTSLAHSDELSADESQRVLQSRARKLAVVPEQAPDTSEILEVMTFTMAQERFAIETRYVREVTTPSGITPLPGSPPFLAGMTNLRGKITAVIDLKVFFAIEEKDEQLGTQIMVLGRDRVDFGMRVEAIDQVTTIRIDEILKPPGSISGASRDFLRGVTADAQLVLDGEALLADGRLYVDVE